MTLRLNRTRTLTPFVILISVCWPRPAPAGSNQDPAVETLWKSIQNTQTSIKGTFSYELTKGQWLSITGAGNSYSLVWSIESPTKITLTYRLTATVHHTVVFDPCVSVRLGVDKYKSAHVCRAEFGSGPPIFAFRKASLADKLLGPQELRTALQANLTISDEHRFLGGFPFDGFQKRDIALGDVAAPISGSLARWASTGYADLQMSGLHIPIGNAGNPEKPLLDISTEQQVPIRVLFTIDATKHIIDAEIKGIACSECSGALSSGHLVAKLTKPSTVKLDTVALHGSLIDGGRIEATGGQFHARLTDVLLTVSPKTRLRSHAGTLDATLRSISFDDTSAGSFELAEHSKLNIHDVECSLGLLETTFSAKAPVVDITFDGTPAGSADIGGAIHATLTGNFDHVWGGIALGQQPIQVDDGSFRANGMHIDSTRSQGLFGSIQNVHLRLPAGQHLVLTPDLTVTTSDTQDGPVWLDAARDNNVIPQSGSFIVGDTAIRGGRGTITVKGTSPWRFTSFAIPYSGMAKGRFSIRGAAFATVSDATATSSLSNNSAAIIIPRLTLDIDETGRSNASGPFKMPALNTFSEQILDLYQKADMGKVGTLYSFDARFGAEITGKPTDAKIEWDNGLVSKFDRDLVLTIMIAPGRGYYKDPNRPENGTMHGGEESEQTHLQEIARYKGWALAVDPPIADPACNMSLFVRPTWLVIPLKTHWTLRDINPSCTIDPVQKLPEPIHLKTVGCEKLIEIDGPRKRFDQKRRQQLNDRFKDELNKFLSKGRCQ